MLNYCLTSLLPVRENVANLIYTLSCRFLVGPGNIRKSLGQTELVKTFGVRICFYCLCLISVMSSQRLLIFILICCDPWMNSPNKRQRFRSSKNTSEAKRAFPTTPYTDLIISSYIFYWIFIYDSLLLVPDTARYWAAGWMFFVRPDTAEKCSELLQPTSASIIARGARRRQLDLLQLLLNFDIFSEINHDLDD